MLGPMGLQMAHGLMPNVPIGVPPPNMQSLLGPPGMMQSMLTSSVNSPFGTGVGVGALLTQIPLPTPTPSDKSNSGKFQFLCIHFSNSNLSTLQLPRRKMLFEK